MQLVLQVQVHHSKSLIRMHLCTQKCFPCLVSVYHNLRVFRNLELMFYHYYLCAPVTTSPFPVMCLPLCRYASHIANQRLVAGIMVVSCGEVPDLLVHLTKCLNRSHTWCSA